MTQVSFVGDGHTVTTPLNQPCTVNLDFTARQGYTGDDVSGWSWLGQVRKDIGDDLLQTSTSSAGTDVYHRYHTLSLAQINELGAGAFVWTIDGGNPSLLERVRISLTIVADGANT